jgi:hypothetical protein
VTVYHGSYCVIENPKISISKYNKDFGTGFYCTELQAQADKWAKRFDTPIVSIFDFITQSGLDRLTFSEMTDDWLDFIVACRSGKQHNYDIVEGAMANDQIWNYIADYISGILSREQFWVLAKFKYPTHQIAFCSRRSLKYLRYLGNYEVAI